MGFFMPAIFTVDLCVLLCAYTNKAMRGWKWQEYFIAAKQTARFSLAAVKLQSAMISKNARYASKMFIRSMMEWTIKIENWPQAVTTTTARAWLDMLKRAEGARHDHPQRHPPRNHPA